jgi:Cysteine-rich secretory protein family
MSRADFVNGMLAVHNRERAAFGSPPLVWSDKLAAESKVWAEHVETTGHMVHAPLPACCEGEGIAGYWAPVGPLAPGNGVYIWVDEKKSYHDHEPVTDESRRVVGHYIMMVSPSVKEVGCGTASGHGIPYPPPNTDKYMSILVCRYIPPGWQP